MSCSIQLISVLVIPPEMTFASNQLRTIEDFLNSADIYELYLLNSKINALLSDDSRIQKIKNSLQIGQSVEYFNRRLNKSIFAIVREKQLKRVLLEHVDDHDEWSVYYYSINLNNSQIELSIHSKQYKLSRTNLSVGDLVGFDNNGKTITGRVKKLNHKSVSVIVTSDMTSECVWRVSYGLLFTAIDVQHNCIDVTPSK